MTALRTALLLLVLCQMPSLVRAQGRDPLAAYRERSLPAWALRVLSPDFRAKYEWYDRVNPFFQHGDFDGDGRADIAVLIRDKRTRKVGIAFVHRASGDVHVVGAGTSFGNGGDDFAWLGAWNVQENRAGAKGEVLYVEKPESAGGLIYWDGTTYQWQQWGD